MPAGLESLEARRLFAAGDVDLSYGVAGLGEVDFGDVRVQLADLAVTSDGDVLATGTARFPQTPDTPTAAAIVRLNGNGLPAAGFGGAEFGFFTDSPGGMDTSSAIALADDGTFFVAGVRDGVGSEPDRVVLAKYTSAGRRDRSFDAQGRGSVLLRQLTAVGDVVVLSNSSILLAGTAGNGDATILKLASNGRPDTTFGVGGLTPTSPPPGSQTRGAGALALDGQDRLVLGITTFQPNLQIPTSPLRTVLVHRYLPNGSIDTSFNGTGNADVPELTSIGGFSDYALRGIAIESDDSVDVYYGRAAGSELQIVRLSDAGVLATSFGDSGIAVVPINFVDDDVLPQARMLLRQDDGSLLAGGGATPTALLLRAAVARFDGDGSLDTSFGNNGVSAVVGLETSTSLLAPSPDGTLIVGAVERSSPNGAQQMQFARMFISDGPVATLKARAITSQTARSQVLTVTYRDSDSVNAASLGDRNLRITGPDGFLRYATFDRVVSNSSQTGTLVARYKLAAPGGEWDSADNGEYVVQLVSGSVRDSDGNFAQARFLGSFTVDVA